MKKEKFYHQDWFIFLTLFLMPPLGLLLMWTGKKFGNTDRIAITVVLSLVTIVSIFLLAPQEYIAERARQQSTHQETQSSDREQSNSENNERESKSNEEHNQQSEAESREINLKTAQSAVEDNTINLTSKGIEYKEDDEIKELIINGISDSKNKIQMLTWTQSLLIELTNLGNLPDWITIRWYGDLAPDREREVLGLFMSFSISAQNLRAVNWSNINNQNLNTIANNYYIRHDLE